MQEQDLLQKFQESQEQKLLSQHEREKRALDTKVESNKRELQKQVMFWSSCVVEMASEIIVSSSKSTSKTEELHDPTPFPLFFFPPSLSPLLCLLSQIFEESTKLQNLRLEQQQTLQKKQLKELREFAEAFSNDKTSLGSTDRQSAERVSVTSEQSQGSSQTNVSMGTASL